MNWDAIGTIADVVGAIAVVVTLLYLAAQIRQNTHQLEQSGRSQRLESLNEAANRFTHWRELLTINSDVASIWRKGRESLRELNEDEFVQFENLIIEMFWCWGMLFFYRDEGALGGLPEEVTRANLRLLADSPGIREWWATSPHRTQYPEEMIQFVDDEYEKSAAQSRVS